MIPRYFRLVVWLGLLVAAGLPASAETVPVVVGEAMVVSAHPLASDVGRDVLLDGGNAVDAAIATAFALAVVEPYSSGLGGGAFAVAYFAEDGSATALDFRETAPAAASRDMFLVEGKAEATLSRDGALSVATPGLVAGLWRLHERHGSLEWSRLVMPAAKLAEEGFPVFEGLRRRIVAHTERFNAAAREVFLSTGCPPAVGDVLVQTDLAGLLQGIALWGPDAFYRGTVAAALVAEVHEAGGLLTHDDLLNYRPVWREVVRGTYRDCEIISMPPPSSGGVHLVQMLNILERWDLAASGHLSATTCHRLGEAMKFAYADRSRWLGDPDFVDVPVARLTSRAYADSQAARIRPDAALDRALIEGCEVLPPESSETTHLSVVDAKGNAAALTATINLSFGSAMVAAGTGVILNDEMDDFVAAPGEPNAFGLVGGEANCVAPAKRPLSSMTPTVVLRDGRVFMVTGSPGGSRIITTTLQTILNVVDHGFDAGRAVAAPRIHDQWYPPFLYHEADALSSDTACDLDEMGHELKERGPMGNAQVIVVDPKTGERRGAADPRGVGGASGY